MSGYLRDLSGIGTAGLGVAVLSGNSDILADGLADLVQVDEGRGDNDLCENITMRNIENRRKEQGDVG